MNVSGSNGQERQKTRTINPSPEISRPYKHQRVVSNRKGTLIFQFSFTRLMLSQNASILKFYGAAIHSSPTLCLYLIQFPRSDSLFQFRYVISLTLVALNISEYNGWTYFTEGNFLDFGLWSPNLEGKKEGSKPGNSKQLLFLLLHQTVSKKSGVSHDRFKTKRSLDETVLDRRSSQRRFFSRLGK